MNWKIIAIIAATAIATAAAVVFVLQKQSSKRKMRFDSSEFDYDDDFVDDIACGEQCNYMDDSVELDAPEKVTEIVEDAADEVEEALAEKDEASEDEEA